MKIFKKANGPRPPRPGDKKKKPDVKETKDEESASSASVSVGNIFPQSLTANHPPAMPSSDTKSLFIKISYLERDNKALHNKAAELTKLRNVNQEVIDSFVNKDEKAETPEKLLLKKCKLLEE